MLQQAVRLRCGEVTNADKEKMKTHLNNLVQLIQAVASHNPCLWSPKQHRTLGYHPAEVFASMKQEMEHFLTPMEHEAMLARRLQSTVSDPVANDLGLHSLMGDSDLHPKILYPTEDI